MRDSDKPDPVEELIRRASLLSEEIDVETASEQPEPSRFQDLQLLGAGSMGEVYRAFDRKLQRFVALKFLKNEDAVLLQQFLREARVQARVEHDGICKVFDTGIEAGRSFIVMQYIAGESLPVAAAKERLERKVLLMKEVSEAVHAAHQAGLIHRDIKPGNILVERREDDTLKPFVLDFGLARDQEAPGLTTTGMLLGTPAYMSPEQARGEAHLLDRRTDVYSLGATLFELIAGRPPHTGATRMEVLAKVLQEDPPELRSLVPSVPVDLNTIVMKCLEKEPQHRYDSARALAEDLKRYVSGEPILARRADWKYRLRKQAKKHKTLVIVSSVGLLAVLVLTGLWVNERWQAARRAHLAQMFGQEAEKLRSLLRYAYVLPLHDLSREKLVVREKMRWMEAQASRDPESGASGYYAIGSAHLGLHEHEDARKYLQLAWKGGYQEPEVAYALGQALGALYQERIQTDPDSRDTAVREFRDPALNYLRAGRGLPDEPPEYVEGLIALYENRYADALSKAREAYSQTPGFYEAMKLEGDVYLASGTDKRWVGDYPRALQDLELAEKAYRSASEIARSDPGVLVGLCAQSYRRMEVISQMRQSAPGFEAALTACRPALQADPENADAYYIQSQIYHRAGEYRMNHGEPFYPLLKESIRMGEQAMKLDPQNASYFEAMGLAYWRMGMHELDHGIDPTFALDQAIAISRKAAQASPKQKETYSLAGLAWYGKGKWFLGIGRDPQNALESALENFRKAEQLNPGWEPALNGINFSLVALAEWDLLMGRDPSGKLQEAIWTGERAVQRYPALAMPLYCLGNAYLKQADAGRDVPQSLAKALQLYQLAAKRNPSLSSAYERQGEIYLRQGSLSESGAAYRKAIELNPDEASAYLGLARLYMASGSTRLARKAVGKARELHPDYYETDLISGKIELMEGNKERGEELLRLSLRRNPLSPEAKKALEEL